MLSDLIYTKGYVQMEIAAVYTQFVHTVMQKSKMLKQTPKRRCLEVSNKLAFIKVKT